ncbi:MAG: AsnC family transcriptional regulator [Rhodospirillaceae bacterium]
MVQSALSLTDLDELDRRLLDAYQHDFPVDERPFLTLARSLGRSEDEVLARFSRLTDAGMIARIGAAFRPNRVGASTLAAMAVPPATLDRVADLVSGYDEVSHNYVRDHVINLWFVVTAGSAGRVDAVLAEIGKRTGLPVLDLPMTRSYRVDMGFPLWS